MLALAGSESNQDPARRTRARSHSCDERHRSAGDTTADDAMILPPLGAQWIGWAGLLENPPEWTSRSGPVGANRPDERRCDAGECERCVLIAGLSRWSQATRSGSRTGAAAGEKPSHTAPLPALRAAFSLGIQSPPGVVP